MVRIPGHGQASGASGGLGPGAEASLAVLLMHGPGAPGFPGAMSLPGPVPDDRLLFAIDRKAAGHGNTEIAGRAALPPPT